jgi:hypothetical protein
LRYFEGEGEIGHQELLLDCLDMGGVELPLELFERFVILAPKFEFDGCSEFSSLMSIGVMNVENEA